MKLQIKQLSQAHFPPFLADYQQDKGEARRFFRYPPTLEKVREAALNCRKKRVKPAGDFFERLWEVNRDLGAGELTRRNIFALKDNAAVVVATGQQPGLLTGNLYCIYKVIQVIRLCETLSDSEGQHYIPLFWTASNDHRHSEADHFNILSAAGFLEEVRIDIANPPNTPFYRIKTEQQLLTTVVAALKEMTIETEFKDSVLAMIEMTFSEASNLADWFNLLLGRLFFKYGLIVFDPVRLPVASQAAAVFHQALENPGLLHQLTAAAGEKIAASGYRVQVPPKTGKLPFFVLDKGERREVTFTGDKAFIGEKSVSFSDLSDVVNNEPQRVSPNVFLRPLLQQALFPVAAFVGGPGEVAYHAQLQEAYAEWGLCPPVIFPRWQFFLEEPKVRRLITRYQLSWEQVASEPHRVIYTVLKKNRGAEFEKKWQDWSAVIRQHLLELPGIMGDSLPEWQIKVDKFRKKMESEWQKLYVQGWAEFKKKEAKTINDLEFVHLAHFPKNIPSERVYNIFPFLIKYGPGFVDDLIAGLDQPEDGAYLIALGGK